MKNKCMQLYQEMLNDTVLQESRQTDPSEWAERCYRVSALASCRLQKMIENHSFTDEQEKRWISITVKPQITAWVEYFTLIYTAELFVPEGLVPKMVYWNRELAKTWNFLMKQEELYLSLKEKSTQEFLADERIANYDKNLAAMIMAKANYMDYVQEKLTGLRRQQENSLFLRA